MDLVWVTEGASSVEQSLLALARERLEQAGWRSAPEGAPGDLAIVWAAGTLPEARGERLRDMARNGTPLLLLGPTVTSGREHAESAGLVAGSWTQPHPARVRAIGSPVWIDRLTPLGDAIELTTEVLAIDKVSDEVEVWLTAQLGLTAHPVLTWNSESRTGALTITPRSPSPPEVEAWVRLIHLTLRRMLGIDSDDAQPTIGVGLLGFGAIGAEHASAVEALPALTLAAVCDRSADRLASAHEQFPSAATTTDPDDLLTNPDVHVVVVSTPPDSHAEWAIRVMESGKDVVVEKPFALSVEAADSVLAAARTTGRRAVVYQNRRFDPDFVTLQGLLADGRLGDVFHIETFIGGYGHPCNYWHSDEDVSGGALYDWGSHVIDQILALHDGPIDHVSCIEHKRKWHDVTNADHTSMTIRYRDGTEASFLHSDLAAALKPRWYLLGTEGAATSTWRTASVVRRNAIGTLDEDVLAVTDSPPRLVSVDANGSETALTPKQAPRFAFHRQLCDAMHLGWPMSVTAEQSRRVVAVMEAARASAHDHGRPVAVDGEP